MIRLTGKALLPVLGLVWAASASVPALARPTYTITDLGALGDDQQVFVQGLNNRGDAAGTTGGSAFLYSEGVMRDLGKLPIGGFATAYGVNDARQVRGYNDRRARHSAEPGDARAFLYQDGALQTRARSVPTTALDMRLITQVRWSADLRASASRATRAAL